MIEDLIFTLHIVVQITKQLMGQLFRIACGIICHQFLKILDILYRLSEVCLLQSLIDREKIFHLSEVCKISGQHLIEKKQIGFQLFCL